MNLNQRDRRAMAMLAVFLLLSGVIYWWPQETEVANAPAVTADEIELAQKRLLRLRQIGATLPSKRDIARRVADEVKGREKGLIPGETAAQAQAQLSQVLRRVGRLQMPPLEVRTVDIGLVRPLGADYGEVAVTVAFDGQIDQLVNFLTDLTRQPEILATNDLRVSAVNEKKKSLRAQLTVSGVVARALVPDPKKGGRS
ncbi:MAG: hypothetical protein K2X03_14590 [Bryobacteraceae bacterium]|nr:hypothetical protein [Bryobacteraceae bacterium]